MDQDAPNDDLLAAAVALGGLRTAVPPHSAEMDRQDDQRADPADPAQTQPFLARVSSFLPIVNRSIEGISSVYTATKNASAVVKRSAESVEEGVRSFTRPVLEPLDRFACSQLDRLERSVPYIFGSATSQGAAAQDAEQTAESSAHAGVSGASQLPGSADLRSRTNSAPIDILAPPSVPLPDIAALHRPVFPEQPYAIRHRQPHLDDRIHPQPSSAPLVDRKPRSRWHQVVAGVGANFNLITQDSIRALRYCLQYIQFAIHNIDVQISILRQHLASAGGSIAQLVASAAPGQNPAAGTVSFPVANLLEVLAAIRREIVETLRKAVDIVAHYAAFCLPGDARQSVRGFILNLPTRLASLTQPAAPQDPLPSTSEQRQDSHAASDNLPVTPTASAPPHSAAHPNNRDESPETIEAKRVLALATESSAMLKGIESVFSRTVSVSEHMLGQDLPHDSSPPSPYSSLSMDTSAAHSPAINEHSGFQSCGSQSPLNGSTPATGLNTAIASSMGSPVSTSSNSTAQAAASVHMAHSTSTCSSTHSNSTVRRRRVRTSSSRSSKTNSLNAAAAAVAAGVLPAGSVAAAAAASTFTNYPSTGPSTPLGGLVGAFTSSADDDAMDIQSETAPSAVSDAYDDDRMSLTPSTCIPVSSIAIPATAADMDLST